MTKENVHLIGKSLLQYHKFINLGIHKNIAVMWQVRIQKAFFFLFHWNISPEYSQEILFRLKA